MKTGGEKGIRTLDRAIRPYNGLANRRLQPLGHLSALSKLRGELERSPAERNVFIIKDTAWRPEAPYLHAVRRCGFAFPDFGILHPELRDFRATLSTRPQRPSSNRESVPLRQRRSHYANTPEVLGRYSPLRQLPLAQPGRAGRHSARLAIAG